MSQPPSQQPPGGFGPPEDPPPGARPDPRAEPWGASGGYPAGPADPWQQQGDPSPYGAPQAPRTPPIPPGPLPAAPYPDPYAAPYTDAYTVPPAAPGYGPPQPPPGAYQQNPGPYGQPQGPGLYGQHPPGPYANGYQGPPQAPAGGGFKGKPGMVIAASVAGLLVLGGGAWFALSGDGTEGGGGKRTTGAGPSPAAPSPAGSDRKSAGTGDAKNGDLNAGRKAGEAKVAFLTMNETDLPRSGADAFGPWVHGDTVVRAMYKEVVGYSVTDGGKKWSLPIATEVCSAAHDRSADGKIVVGIKDGTGEKAECRDLRMIDIATGKVGWEQKLRTGGGFGSLTDFTLTISGDTVGAAGLGNSLGFSLADGKQLFKGPVKGCKPYAFAGGGRLLAAASCPSSDFEKPRQQIQDIHPVTGKPKWSHGLPVGWQVDKVFSVTPVVVSIKQAKEKKWAVLALNEDGTERSQIQGGKDRFAPRCGGAFVILGENLEGCVGVAADRKNFYMATQPETPGGPNEIVAFGLDDGKPLWREPSGGDSTMLPLRMEGGRVLLYREPTFSKGGLLATVGPEGGRPVPLLRMQDATARTENRFHSSRLAYDSGRLFIAGSRISAPNDAEELKTPTMMAFAR
ncbi:PQQ-binding-like beta-propeller repeat protein [Streptomyces sp. CAU 1734]|uniref:outer membrane protein assembly factor BamB family protein n=1 Tax=Streptomyces sp. CAU 1734 TaxID=3140360 RepID=UPI00326044F0